MRKDYRLDVLCIVARRLEIFCRLSGAAGERIRPVAGVDDEQILAVLHRERIEGRYDLVTRQAIGGERILKLFEARASGRARRQLALTNTVGDRGDLDVADLEAVEAGRGLRLSLGKPGARQSQSCRPAKDIPPRQRSHAFLLLMAESK